MLTSFDRHLYLLYPPHLLDLGLFGNVLLLDFNLLDPLVPVCFLYFVVVVLSALTCSPTLVGLLSCLGFKGSGHLLNIIILSLSDPALLF